MRRKHPAFATNTVAFHAYEIRVCALFLPANRVFAFLLTAFLCACTPPPLSRAPDVAAQLQTLLPAHALLLGEQHDNPDHQRIEREVVQALAASGRLAALALEMAERGHSTQGLADAATTDDVRAALHWNERAWPWAHYAPAIMAAVRSGVPVLGANLPRVQMRAAMGNVALDTRLDAQALNMQQDAIREGHCDALPASQIGPMTRIQIARDIAMADTLVQAVAQAAPAGQTVLLLAGSGHVDKTLGVPRHLPPQTSAKSVLLGVRRMAEAAGNVANFDAAWPAKSIPDKDYCADFQAQRPG
jgi:uncharacterized iron-regulated protein